MQDFSEDEKRELAIQWGNAQGLSSWTPEPVTEEALSTFPDTGQLLFHGQAMQESVLSDGQSLFVHCEPEGEIIYYHVGPSIPIAEESSE